MGMGPAPATRKVLERAGLSLKDIDLIEVNEAFAAQYLSVEKELGLDRDRVNVNGGAIALGHPLGMTGTRLLLTLTLELRRRGLKRGLATACIGGGQGIAAIIETCLRPDLKVGPHGRPVAADLQVPGIRTGRFRESALRLEVPIFGGPVGIDRGRRGVSAGRRALRPSPRSISVSARKKSDEALFGL